MISALPIVSGSLFTVSIAGLIGSPPNGSNPVTNIFNLSSIPKRYKLLLTSMIPRCEIPVLFPAVYLKPIASIKMICTTIIRSAIGIWALITDHLGSFVSRTAQGTILKFAAMGVINVPQ